MRVSCEFVRYNSQRVLEAASGVVYTFSKHSGIEGSQTWIRSLQHLGQIVKDQRPQPVLFSSFAGMEMIFSGMPSASPTVGFDELTQSMQYIAQEPFFLFTVSNRFGLASQRNNRDRVIEAIREEMGVIYGMRSEPFPKKLVFPKQIFAAISVHEGTLL